MSKKKLFVGIDHSVNKSTLVAINEMGNPVFWIHIAFSTANGKIKVLSSNLKEPILGKLEDKASHLEKAKFAANYIKNQMDSIVESYDLNIAIEDYSYFSQGRTHMIAENGGVFKYLIGHKLTPVNIKKVKVHGAGNGGADKDLMRESLIEKYGEKFLNEKLIDNEDIIDAFFIADFLRSGGI